MNIFAKSNPTSSIAFFFGIKKAFLSFLPVNIFPTQGLPFLAIVMDFCTAPKYTLKEILAVSTIHPFYNSSSRFPPTQAQIDAIIGDKQDKQCPDLTNLPLTQKDTLYAAT